MHRPAIAALHGGCHALLRGHRLAQRLPAVVVALGLELQAQRVHEVVGQHADEQVPLDAPVDLVEHRALAGVNYLGIYDTETGQLLTGGYMDCAMPRADDLPSFTVETAGPDTRTPCTHNPLGFKGCGEAGPSAVINAIGHALGVKDVAMPATPYTVWKAARAAQAAASTAPR